MTNGDRIVVLATERRGVIDRIARDGRCVVLLDGDTEPHSFDPQDIDVCCQGGYCEA